MRRRLFTLLSILSLLMAMGSGVVWVRSYWIADEFSYARLDRDRIVGPYFICSLYLDRGRFGGQKLRSGAAIGDQGLKQFLKLGFQHEPAEPGDLLAPTTALALHFEKIDTSAWDGGPVKGWNFQLQFWALMVVLLIMPGAWVWREIRRRRIARRGFAVVSASDALKRHQADAVGGGEDLK